MIHITQHWHYRHSSGLGTRVTYIEALNWGLTINYYSASFGEKLDAADCVTAIKFLRSQIT